jgi:hydrogenase nickel incorporation protein HypA/HybF
MHEFSMMANIFKVIEQTARANDLVKIKKVKLKIGELRQIAPDIMQFAFATVAKETIAKEAKLEIEFVPIILKCHHCAKEFSVNENIYICPECGNVDLETLSGKEIVIETIEGEKCK